MEGKKEKEESGGGMGKEDGTEERKGALAEMMEQRGEDENVERGNWNSDLEFILACVGYAIGLGNVWRFPYLMYRYGGAFLFAYWLLLILVAFPVFFYELSLGQFASAGPLEIFRKTVPGLEGLGWATLWVQFANTVYYNAIHGYAIFYAFSSFGQPWSRCRETEDWYSAPCYSAADYRRCVQGRPDWFYFAKGRCYNPSSISLAYLHRLEDCILSTSSFEHKPYCHINLILPFNATTPRNLFPLISPDWELPDNCKLGGERAFFQSWDQCQKTNVPASDSHQLWDNNRDGDKPLIINLGQGEHGSFNGTDARAACLRSLLAHSQLSPEGVLVPQMASILAAYCNTTYGFTPAVVNPSTPLEANGPNAQCLATIIDNLETYSSQQYYRYFIESTQDVRDIGRKGIKYNLVLSMAFAWFLTGFGLWKGPKWTGKLVYVTAVFPMFMILILIIVSATLDGSLPSTQDALNMAIWALFVAGHWDGIQFYITTEWCNVKDSEMWVAALSQIFFSISIGTGGLQTLASYNRFHNDLVRDAVIVTLSNGLFSLIAGFGLFGIIGHMAKQVNTPVPQVLRGGEHNTGLAFIVMAQATTVLPGGEILAFFFYLMLILLAIDSAFANVETLLTFVYDEFPPLRKHRFVVVFTTSVLFFLVGLPFVSRLGNVLVGLIDEAIYIIAVPMVLFACLLTTFAVYGFKRYFQDIYLMLGVRPANRFSLSAFVFNSPLKWYWYVTLLGTAPIGVFALIVSNWVKLIKDWNWSLPASYINIFIGVVPLVLIMVGALAWVMVKKGLRGAALFRPTPEWGPALSTHRTGRYLPYNNIPPVSTAPTTASNPPAPNPIPK